MGDKVIKRPTALRAVGKNTALLSRDTFVPTKIVLKVVFLERDFEHDHLAEKSYWTKMGQKIHCGAARNEQFCYKKCRTKSDAQVKSNCPQAMHLFIDN
jgi:hypothetical protein